MNIEIYEENLRRARFEFKQITAAVNALAVQDGLVASALMNEWKAVMLWVEMAERELTAARMKGPDRLPGLRRLGQEVKQSDRPVSLALAKRLLRLSTEEH